MAGVRRREILRSIDWSIAPIMFFSNCSGRKLSIVADV
jgi:hypothetical protein